MQSADARGCPVAAARTTVTLLAGSVPPPAFGPQAVRTAFVQKGLAAVTAADRASIQRLNRRRIRAECTDIAHYAPECVLVALSWCRQKQALQVGQEATAECR